MPRRCTCKCPRCPRRAAETAASPEQRKEREEALRRKYGKTAKWFYGPLVEKRKK